MEVTLYTTHCPKCRVVETKLKTQNINYVECSNVDEMLKLGASSAPLLKVDDRLLTFNDAIKWINSVKK